VNSAELEVCYSSSLGNHQLAVRYSNGLCETDLVAAEITQDCDALLPVVTIDDCGILLLTGIDNCSNGIINWEFYHNGSWRNINLNDGAVHTAQLDLANAQDAALNLNKPFRATVTSNGCYKPAQAISFDLAGDMEYSECGELSITSTGLDCEGLDHSISWDKKDINGQFYVSAPEFASLSTIIPTQVGTYKATIEFENGLFIKSERLIDQLNLTPSPVGEANYQVCAGSTTSQIDVVGKNLIWYADKALAITVLDQDILTSGIYYLTQTIDNCTSLPIGIQVDIITIESPVIESPLSICYGADLTTINNLLQESFDWYLNDALVAADQLLIDGAYEVVRVEGVCESVPITVEMVVEDVLESGGSMTTEDISQCGIIDAGIIEASEVQASGSTITPRFLWQFSEDGEVFVDMTDATEQNFNHGTISVPVWYRRMALPNEQCDVEDTFYTDPIKFEPFTEPQFELTASQDLYQEGEEIVISVTELSNCFTCSTQWSPTDIGADVYQYTDIASTNGMGSASQTYSLTMLYGKDCSITKTITVNVESSLSVTADHQDGTCGSDGEINFYFNDIASQVQVQLSIDAGASWISVDDDLGSYSISVASGTYDLMARREDGSGQLDLDDITVSSTSTVDISEIVIVHPSVAPCTELRAGSITIQATGESIEYSIEGYSSFSSTNLFDGLSEGTYSIIIRDSSTGCEVTSSATLTDDACDPCLSDVNIISQDQSELDYEDVKSTNYIEANDLLINHGKKTFSAGEYIELQPVFEVELGTEFLAQIEDCDCTAGLACDDQDDCTINDVLDANCDCAGTFQDSDADGTCDADEVICVAGDPCDDADLCTINDILDADCHCQGTFQDTDGDGVCDADEVCTPGTPCDDLDPCTITDVYDANCDCAGVIQDTDQDGIADGCDQCEGHDDTIDEDGDGVPDACDSDLIEEICELFSHLIVERLEPKTILLKYDGNFINANQTANGQTMSADRADELIDMVSEAQMTIDPPTDLPPEIYIDSELLYLNVQTMKLDKLDWEMLAFTKTPIVGTRPVLKDISLINAINEIESGTCPDEMSYENDEDCHFGNDIVISQVDSPDKSVISLDFMNDIRGEIVTVEVYDLSHSEGNLVKIYQDMIAGPMSIELEREGYYSIIVIHGSCPYDVYATESLGNLCEISYEIDLDADPTQECYTKELLLLLLGCPFVAEDCVSVTSDDYDVTVEPYCFENISGEIRISITNGGTIIANPIVNINFSEIPDDGIDNNGDDLIDCHDPDLNCPEDTVELCFDGQDNDNNDLSDELDPQCVKFYMENTLVNCMDGFNNDGDSENGEALIDVFDPDCWQILIDAGEIGDSDLDGMPDAVDTEDCADGLDNDGDGLIDCRDPDCSPLSRDCIEDNEITCFNGYDDDQDGLTDELDLGCYEFTSVGDLILSMELDGYDCVDGELVMNVYLSNETNDFVGLADDFRWGVIYNNNLFTTDVYISSSLFEGVKSNHNTHFEDWQTNVLDINTYSRFVSRFIDTDNVQGNAVLKPFEKRLLASLHLSTRAPQDRQLCLDDFMFTQDNLLTQQAIDYWGGPSYTYFSKEDNEYHNLTIVNFDSAPHQDILCIGQSCEICGNGVDDDMDGIEDCDEQECKSDPLIIQVNNEIASLNQLNIWLPNGESLSDYQICVGSNCMDSSTGIISNISEISYYIEVFNSFGCAVTYIMGHEICDNGIDDDGDSFIDCKDNDCKPGLVSLDITNEVCNNSGGIINIQATGDDIEYELSGEFQIQNIFSDLTEGEYEVNIRNKLTGCTFEFAQPVIIENTCEILGNDLDDDGDDAADCEDNQHYARFREVDFSFASCDSDDAWVIVEALGDDLTYYLSGVYYEIKDVPLPYTSTNKTGSFLGLPPGSYTIEITNGLSGCQNSVDFSIVRDCEICDNEVDDDGDGDIDCEDLDCVPIDYEDDGEPSGSTLKEINKKAKSICHDVPISLEIFRKFAGYKQSADIFGQLLDTDLLTNSCDNEKSYFVAGDGPLIDPEKVENVVFIDPNSPFYNELKNVVLGFTASDGKYYQAVIRTISSIPDDLYLFTGYYEFDRTEREFGGLNILSLQLSVNEISEDIYIENEDKPGTAILYEYSGDHCLLKYSCLTDWSYVRPPADQLLLLAPLSDLQDHMATELMTNNTNPSDAEICPTENEGDILLFVNGYRFGQSVTNFNLLAEDEEALKSILNSAEGLVSNNNGVYFNDPFNYWNHHAKFKSKLKPSVTLFADGHNHINTSNHNNIPKFIRSFVGAGKFGKEGFLNDTANDGGFMKRMNAGRLAGRVLINKIESGEIATTKTNNIIDQKLDIVAHSMGYAYALGIVKEIQDLDFPLEFNRFYILAPENPGTQSSLFDLRSFEEVWQYGSARNRPVPLQNENSVKEQDGVAAQTSIPVFIEFSDSEEYGRAFIPETVDKGFLKSHTEANYEWLFIDKLLPKGFDGYIKFKEE